MGVKKGQGTQTGSNNAHGTGGSFVEQRTKQTRIKRNAKEHNAKEQETQQ
jgi:hypothetical protein